MSASFEIIRSGMPERTAQKANRHQSFSTSALKSLPFMAASLTMANSYDVVANHAVYDLYQPAFIAKVHYQDQLAVALRNDYEIQTELLRKLDFLKSTLKDNWNGENDLPIEEGAYNNTRNAIKSTPGLLLKQWRLFPNPNGTLLLSHKGKQIAGISIGNEEFSYAAFVSDDRQISGKEPFTGQAFKYALIQIQRVLGND